MTAERELKVYCKEKEKQKCYLYTHRRKAPREEAARHCWGEKNIQEVIYERRAHVEEEKRVKACGKAVKRNENEVEYVQAHQHLSLFCKVVDLINFPSSVGGRAPPNSSPR